MIIHHTHKKLSDSLIKELYDNFTTDDCLVDDIYTTFRGVYSKHFPDEIENFYRKNLSIILTKLGLAGRVVVEELKVVSDIYWFSRWKSSKSSTLFWD